MSASSRRFSTNQLLSQSLAHYFHRMSRLDATERGVIAVPAHGNSADNWWDPLRSDKLLALARFHFVVIGVDSGPTWGNDVGLGYMNDGVTYLQGTSGGAKSGNILLYATSMGGVNALNYAKRNLSTVSAIALVCTPPDVEDVRANNRGGFTQASIETAYGNNSLWQTARPTRNPVEFASQLAAIPVRIWYTTDDPFVMTSCVDAFATAHGNTTKTNMGTGGHDFTLAPPNDVAGWLQQYA